VVSLLEVAAELRLVELQGTGLARMGATAAVSSGGYDISQPWSRAIFVHPATVDGIVYRSNHDNGELGVALFDRCRTRIGVHPPTALLGDRRRLASLLVRYQVGLG
jgi:hypothetical protein